MLQIFLRSRAAIIWWFTGYPWRKKFGKSPNTHQVTDALNEIFLAWGYPKHVKSDGGGQYRTEFEQYCANMYITPHTTSGYNLKAFLREP